MTAVVTACAGFLLSVLWFDLMFDVQVIKHRRAADVPDDVLASIAAYYRRVTTTASPMGRLVGLVMVVLIVGLVVQVAVGDAPVWASVISIPATLIATGLAGARVLRNAQRLGTRADSTAVQSELARGILRDHLVCLAFMSATMAAQIAGAFA